MSKIEISLVAVEVRKWDLESQKINLLSYYIINNEEKSFLFDVSILHPPEMVEEFLGKLRYVCEQSLRELPGNEEISVDFDNETFLRQKIYNYFKRITSELNSNRRKKGHPKMIFTTHMDVYNENQDISFLAPRNQFFVVLNWARKYYEKEDYKKAIEPLRKLIKVNPEYGLGYKWLARSLKKIRKYDEAMRYYEKYAEVDNSTDAWLDLAKSYRKGKLFDKSEQIYRRVLENNSTNQEARIGLAQISYANKNEAYLKIFDELEAEDPQWLKNWLAEEFNFRIYVPEKTLLSPVQASKFLGFEQIFELTQRAFKNEIPSHFNPSKARLSFYKEELENWATIMNRYGAPAEQIILYPDRISAEELVRAAQAEHEKSNAAKDGDAKKADASRTKVEEILTAIRARKAQKRAQGFPQPQADAGRTGKHSKASDKNNNKSTKRRSKIKKQPPVQSAAIKEDEKITDATVQPLESQSK